MECKNCNNHLDIKDKFCSDCGQKNISKLSLKYVFGEFFQTVFNLDSKVFKSLKFLIFKPGVLSKEYIEGKRVSYLPPIRIYIALSFIYFFLISVISFDDSNLNFTLTVPENSGVNLNDRNDKTDSGIPFVVDGKDVYLSASDIKKMKYEGTLKHNLDSLTEDMGPIYGYISRKYAMAQVDDEGFEDVLRDQSALFLILFLPFFAMLYGLVFRKSKKGFIGHLIFNLHLNSFILFMLLLDLVIELLIGEYETVNLIWGLFLVVYIIYYLIRAIMKFYNRKWWAAFYKFLLLLIGYTVLAIVFLLVVLLSSMIAL
jgi:hypothetical protein